jgi:hypothetical protein
VQHPLDLLLKCVERMPATGKFFTAQSPLGPIFLAGLVSVNEAERSIIRKWFCTVTARGSKSVRSVLSLPWKRLILMSHPECTAFVEYVTTDLATDGHDTNVHSRSGR